MEFKFDLKDPKYEYITDIDGLNRAVEILEKQRVIAVDVESTSLDPFTGTLLMIQISSEDTCYVFDTRSQNLGEIERFKNLLENSSIVKLLHNGKFDYKFIKTKTKIEVVNIFDTMLAELVLTAGLGGRYFKLTDLAKQYCDIDLDKAIRSSFYNMSPNSRFTEEQLKYGALDTLVLFPIFEEQLKRLQKENLLDIAKLEFATTRAVGNMELTGIYLDKEKWRNILVDLAIKRDAYLKEFQDAVRPMFNISTTDLFGNITDAININSQVQLMDLFNNKLKLNLPSTGDAILNNVSHPVAKMLRNYRKYEKLLSAFGEGLLEKINPVTGRLHPEFNQLGTATGRFSCNNPNLQQIPRNSKEAPFRTCFNPRPGYKLVTADYSSFEMRILAELSQDAKMVKALNEGLDIHSYTASLMFNKEYSADFKSKYPDLRQIAKPIGFGLMYGMGSMGLANSLEMEGVSVTKEVAQDYMDKYFASYPSVKKYLDSMADSAVKKGYSKTPAGRKRWYHKPEKDDPEFKRKVSQIQREAKNHPIQGTNADAIKYALVYLNDRMKREKIDGGIILTVHDEIVSEIREDQAENWAQVQSDEMVRAAKLFIKTVGVKSDPFVGDVWEH